LAIIKPDAVKAGLVEEIIAKVSSTKINLNDANHPERFFVDGNFESKLDTFLDITSSCCEKCNHRSNLVPRALPMGKTLVGAGHVTLQK
jgi:hypothetical protein